MGFIAHDFLSTTTESTAEGVGVSLPAAFNNNLCDLTTGTIGGVGAGLVVFNIHVDSTSLTSSPKIAIGLIGLSFDLSQLTNPGKRYNEFFLSVTTIGGSPIRSGAIAIRAPGRWNQLDNSNDKSARLINAIVILEDIPSNSQEFEFVLSSIDSLAIAEEIKFSFQKIFIGNCFDDLCFDFDNTVVSKELTGNIQKTQAGGTVPITPQIVQRINTRINKVTDSDLFDYGSNYYGLSNLTNFNKWSPIIVSPFDYKRSLTYNKQTALYMNNIIYGNLTSPISYRKINNEYWTYDLSIESEN